MSKNQNTKRKIEFWTNPYGAFMETEQNPCGCHPFDFIVRNSYQSPGIQKSGITISFGSRKKFRNHYHVWEKLK